MSAPTGSLSCTVRRPLRERRSGFADGLTSEKKRVVRNGREEVEARVSTGWFSHLSSVSVSRSLLFWHTENFIAEQRRAGRVMEEARVSSNSDSSARQPLGQSGFRFSGQFFLKQSKVTKLSSDSPRNFCLSEMRVSSRRGNDD